MNIDAFESSICKFIRTELQGARNLPTLKPRDSLFALGLLDSLAVMRIVAFCEEEFDIAIPDEELMPDNFESVHTLARLIERIKCAANRQT
jgi:acyl carrier protein